MDTEGKFWVCVWGIAAIVAVSVVMAVESYNTHANTIIGEMVANGADPIDARCAIDGYGNEPACVLVAGTYQAKSK